MQASRHLLSRASHCLRVGARLAVASPLTLASLSASKNACRRGLVTSRVASQHGITELLHLASGKTSVTATTATASPDSAMLQLLQVCWTEGGMDMFPYVWLRDNCQCPSCFNPSTFSRQLAMQDLQLNVSASSIQVVNGGGVVEVLWSDGHLGTYPASWLHERAFNKASQERRKRFHRLPRSPWGSEMLENLPRASFPELLEDDAALLTFIQQLEITGLVLVSDVPCRVQQIPRLADRIGFLVPTHYGEIFSVQSKLDPNNLAYTAEALDMHTDQPYLDYLPQIQLLHCITQHHMEGGENFLADSYNAAQILHSLHPDKFQVLTSVPVDFFDIGVENGKEYFIMNRQPVISLDHDGNFEGVRINTMVRDSFFLTSADKVAAWYDAKLIFFHILNDPQNHIMYKMKEGDMIVMDNLRVLHGRTGFKPVHGERHLEGSYFNWDQVLSQRRILQTRLASN